MSIASNESGHDLGAQEVELPNPRHPEEGKNAVGAAALKAARITAEGLVVPHLDTDAGGDNLAALGDMLAGLDEYFSSDPSDVEFMPDLGEAAERRTDI